MLFHEDNAPVHTSSQVLAVIRNAGFELLHQPSYLPNLAPAGFYLFLKLKELMKECKFTDDKDVICMANGRLKEENQQFFYNGIPALEKHGTTRILVAGDYVEK